jgi:hypothetical protein
MADSTTHASPQRGRTPPTKTANSRRSQKDPCAASIMSDMLTNLRTSKIRTMQRARTRPDMHRAQAATSRATIG